MVATKFLQVHTLHPYTAVLLNRDENELAKRMPFGGATRIRISSQSLKRHWRMAEGEYALKNIEGFEDSVRTRNAISEEVMKNASEADIAEDVLTEMRREFDRNLYSEAGNQPLLLGKPEIDYLRVKADEIGKQFPIDKDEAGRAVRQLFQDKTSGKDNLRAMRNATELPAGLLGALFGRMITSDPWANIDASVHVAHSFTVHDGEPERNLDYFTAVDDLPLETQGPGAAHIGDTELTAGIFYGYVVVDVEGLIGNLHPRDKERWRAEDEYRTLAASVVEHLVHLIATVSPGAKLGSTAPYGYADLMLIEAGGRQPRSLANAFRSPARAQVEDAVKRLSEHLSKLDNAYGNGEARRVMSVEECEMPEAERLNCNELASWVAEAVRKGEARP